MKKLLSLLLVLILSFGVLASCGTSDEPQSGSTSDTVAGDSSNTANSSNADENEDTTNNNTDKTSIKLSVLNGTTGFGMAYLMSLDENGTAKNDYEFKVETDASNIVSGLIGGSIDMAALPTNAAANVYNISGGKVQILAINTLGVLYLLEKGNEIGSIEDLKKSDKKIYVPAQNPRFITEYILTSNGISADRLDSTTYSTPAALQTAVVAGQVELAVLPQPVVTAAIASAKSSGITYRSALNLTAEWDKIPGSEKLVQGCLVVRKEFAQNNKNAINDFLTEYESSIKYLNDNPKDAAVLIEKYKIFAKAAIAEKAIPACNVTFMKGNEMKSAMSAFIEVMFNIAPASVGGRLPANDFYYIP